MRPLFILCLIMSSSFNHAANAQDINRFWIMWEIVDSQDTRCNERERCDTLRRYTTRLLDTSTEQEMRNIFGALDQRALTLGMPVEHPDAPRICQAYDPEVLLGFDPEQMEKSDRLLALKDLPGVHFSVLRLSAPEGYDGNFGLGLQTEFESQFRAAGIRILSEDEMAVAPGQPQLNIYFSNANQTTGCHYSIYASLSQTMLLTRNVKVKLKVGTWGMSEGPSDEFPLQNEYDAILRVAAAFVEDYREANSTDILVQN